MGVNLQAYRIRRGLTQTQVVAEIYKRAVGRGDGEPGLDPCAVSRHENGHKRPSPYYQKLYCEVYEASPAELGFISLADVAEPDFTALEPAHVLATTLTPDSVSASVSVALKAEGFDDFVAALLQHEATSSPAEAPIHLLAWEEAGRTAKRNLQACRYALAMTQLTSVLRGLPIVGAALDGDDAPHAWTICAHAYHTAAGLLLKLGHDALAHIAADRSMAFAKRSQDPLTVGARIVAHALLSSGHLREARTIATSAASRLDGHDSTPQRLSVYGSLLLRLAVTERRACLYIDAARALVQWDRYAEACHMLTAAQRLAPEELTSRPSVRAIIGDIVRRAPRSAQPIARALAAGVGAHHDVSG
jgi:hypothetical protein